MSSTSNVSTSSPTASSVPETNDPRVAILGTILALLAAVIVIGVVFIVLRMRKRRRLRDTELEGRRKSHRYHGSMVLDKSHPATNIVPFGTPGVESHSFNHVPGEDMRIAIRRPDGAWDFTDPNDPFTPSGITDINPFATPSSSTTRLVSNRNGKHERECDDHFGSRTSLSLSTHTTTTATTAIMNAPSIYHESIFDPNSPITTNSSPTFPQPIQQSVPRSFGGSVSSISGGGGGSGVSGKGYCYAQSRELRVVTPDVDLELSDLPLPYPPPAYGQEPTMGLNATFKRS